MPKARLSKMAQKLSQLPETQQAIDTELQKSKIKTTYALPADLLASLERGQTELRTMVKPKVRGQINRSLLVELAVKVALNDLSINGKESQIYRHTESYLSGSAG